MTAAIGIDRLDKHGVSAEMDHSIGVPLGMDEVDDARIGRMGRVDGVVDNGVDPFERTAITE